MSRRAILPSRYGANCAAPQNGWVAWLSCVSRLRGTARYGLKGSEMEILDEWHLDVPERIWASGGHLGREERFLGFG